MREDLREFPRGGSVADPRGDAGTVTLDRAHLARMTLGDTALETEILGLFMRQADDLVAGMHAGGDIAALAHALRGAAGGIGAFRLAEAAAEVELASGEGMTASRDAVMRLEIALADARRAIEAALRTDCQPPQPARPSCSHP